MSGSRLTAMRRLIAPGLLMGGRDVLNIWRKVACLDRHQRDAIGLRMTWSRDKITSPYSVSSSL